MDQIISFLNIQRTCLGHNWAADVKHSSSGRKSVLFEKSVSGRVNKSTKVFVVRDKRDLLRDPKRARLFSTRSSANYADGQLESELFIHKVLF